jgi:hypothetical protein
MACSCRDRPPRSPRRRRGCDGDGERRSRNQSTSRSTLGTQLHGRASPAAALANILPPTGGQWRLAERRVAPRTVHITWWRGSPCPYKADVGGSSPSAPTLVRASFRPLCARDRSCSGQTPGSRAATGPAPRAPPWSTPACRRPRQPPRPASSADTTRRSSDPGQLCNRVPAVAVIVELPSELHSTTPELRRVRFRHLGIRPAASAANARCPGIRGNSSPAVGVLWVWCTGATPGHGTGSRPPLGQGVSGGVTAVRRRCRCGSGDVAFDVEVG